MSKKKDNNFVGLPQVEGLDIYAFRDYLQTGQIHTNTFFLVNFRYFE
jgi:hypothetical protein